MTDTLFVSRRDEQRLAREGFTVERLDKPQASEDELVEAVKGKDAYIIGGVEQVTERVLDAADSLRALVFTGAGYKEFIPAHRVATERGIPIANAPGGNAYAVAEYTQLLMGAMTRNIFELGRTGSKSFATTESLRDATVGIVGLGHIGTLLAQGLRAAGVGEVLYHSRTRRYHLEAGLALTFTPMEELLRKSDVISIHVSKDAGEPLIGAAELDLLRDGALIVNCAYPEAIDWTALELELARGRLRAAYDAPPEGADERNLPLSHWFCSNAQTGFNTSGAVDTVGEMVTNSVLNLLRTGNDLFLVNPGYRTGVVQPL